jgi:hypothetical protein
MSIDPPTPVAYYLLLADQDGRVRLLRRVAGGVRPLWFSFDAWVNNWVSFDYWPTTPVLVPVAPPVTRENA